MSNGTLNVSPPIYLVGMKIACWKCGDRMPVVALLAPSVDESDGMVAMLIDIRKMPDDVLSYVRRRVPGFRLKYSKAVERKYYGNVCSRCDTLFGDFFLHSEPEAPFFPKTPAQAKRLYLTELPIEAPIEFHAYFHVGTGDLILENAKRIA